MKDTTINKIVEAIGRFASFPHLVAIREGMYALLPLSMIGSVFLLLAAMPIPGYPELMTSIFGPNWQLKLLYPASATFDILALVTCISISYRLAGHYKVNPIGNSLISVCCFLLATPYQLLTPASEAVTMVIPLALLGSRSIFVAIIIAFLSTEIFRIAIQKNWVIRMPSSVPLGAVQSFSSVIPGFLAVTTVWIIRLLIEQFEMGSLHEVLHSLLAAPLSNITGTVYGAILSVLLAQFFWFFGIHGDSLILSIFLPTFVQLGDQNRMAYQAGEELPNIIAGSGFMDTFARMGGAGCTLPLILIMIIFAKSQQYRSLAKITFFPGLFNINEPVIFGLPIVLNPFLAVPFVLAPVFLVAFMYCVTAWGLCPKLAGIALPFTTPFFLQSYLGTGGKLTAVLWQLLCFIMASLFWFPFFKAADKLASAREREAG